MLKSIISFIYDLLSTQVFWLFMLSLMGLGRWLLVRETILFASKKETALTEDEKKKKKRLLFFGKGFLFLGFPFMVLFGILSFLS